MFRIITFIVLVIAFGWLIVLMKNRRIGRQNLNSIFEYLKWRKQEKKSSFLSKLRVISFGWTVLFFLLLTLTGFTPLLLTGSSTGGLPLILHILIAPFFLFALTVWILLTAQKMRFKIEDLNLARALIRKSSSGSAEGLKQFIAKILFWVFLFFSIVAILAVILSLYPLFGSQGMRLLIEIHRYSALVLLIIAFLAFYNYFQQSQRTNVKEK
ncbi:MAG: hypothetical protein GXO77_16625 [Calditrichaeota bacterium]|nr:hypothetical protein [Calditrichota bacterium]